MRIVLCSQVKADFENVAADFGHDLFIFLLPPKFFASLVAYEGSSPGSKVHIRFNLPFPSDWISIIKSEQKDDEKYIFIDEGEKLPFGLKQWKHIHSIEKGKGNCTKITDDMNFSTGINILDFLMYPFLFLSFYPRKKLYKKYFEK
ncbi:MAG: hypothetical protein K9H16_03725 [Bacteroidales bacterium]|nr:hypothetical protein [Bacteroidales bacterium]